MRLALVALTLMALTPLQAAASGRISKNDYYHQILVAPTSGDEYTFQKTFHQDAQDLSNKMFGRLASVLGGDAPQLNFAPAGTPGLEGDFSANLTDRPGFPKGTINVDPQAVQSLIDGYDTFHSSAVNALPHEMMHTRQLPQVLASVADREGGAQAFADLVTPLAAAAAGTHYDVGNYDGPYADYVKQAQTRGLAWILGGQMGKPPVSWP